MSSLHGKWALSTDEEMYHGTFDSMEEAIEEGNQYDVPTFWIGQVVDPVQPEELFDRSSVREWLEQSVYEHDDYLGEWAEGAVYPSDEQADELAAEIRPIIAAWLERHKLRPNHWNIDPKTVRKVNRKGGAE